MTTPNDEPDEETEPTTVEIEINEDRSILTIEGRRDVSVIVRSEAGERVYLPPESFDSEGDTTTTPYSTSPYSTASRDEAEDDDDGGPETTPYSTSTDANVDAAENVNYGRKNLPQGIRIVHPEPVTDIRVLH